MLAEGCESQGPGPPHIVPTSTTPLLPWLYYRFYLRRDYVLGQAGEPRLVQIILKTCMPSPPFSKSHILGESPACSLLRNILVVDLVLRLSCIAVFPCGVRSICSSPREVSFLVGRVKQGAGTCGTSVDCHGLGLVPPSPGLLRFGRQGFTVYSRLPSNLWFSCLSFQRN